MNKKLATPLLILVLLSMLFTACAPTAPAVEAPAAPAVTEAAAPAATEAAAPAAAEEAPAIDVEALWSELIAALPADKGYGSVAAAKLNEELVEKAPFMLDVREAAEIEKDGFIKDAVNIPVRDVMKNLDKLPAADQPIVVMCASGHRGGFVLSALKLLGYENVRNLGGGVGAWKKAGLPTEIGKPAEAKSMTAPEIADEALFTMLEDFMTNLPEGFYATNSEKLNTALVETKPFLLDVRSDKEYDESGYIAGAIHVQFQDLMSNLDKLPAKDSPIVIYCASGHRGAIAQMGLLLMGYEKVTNLGGGLNAWKAAQYPVEGWVDWNAVWGDYLAGLPAGFSAVGAADLNTELVEKAPFLLDVREASEIEKDGFIMDAVNIPTREVLKNLDKLPAQDQPIVVYCASGHRGGFVMAALQMLGYENVRNLGGGFGAWKKAGLAAETGAPAEAVAATAPKVDETRFAQLDAFLSGLPDGFLAMKPADVNLALAETEKPFLLDVREADELTKDGAIEGAVNIPVIELFTRLAELPKEKDAKIVVFCKSGHRGAIAQMALLMNGYSDVVNMGGGLGAWVAAELPVVK
ncbi:MAG: rhodanese-like domain-containing protein [Anaerolineaceae bacterium]